MDGISLDNHQIYPLQIHIHYIHMLIAVRIYQVVTEYP